ncbi:hypothetical protein [Boudabousia marimammalium]|uniref:Response regulatory domain-containing protein n=1 Tax=Boudabousia marimammalium TaxID=156892 RepID=A0A1Q5PR36_9ACTO|nr:hypothetical protein [Boudabousia marimammalium]OKL49932.1 hypothetical protein BM477_03235 [Boudabousia marimammalium]
MANKDHLNILVFSDDSSFREEIKAAIGLHPYVGSPQVTFHDAATSFGVTSILEENHVDLAIFDGEVQKDGAMSVAHTVHDTLPEDSIPPIVFIVARQQDEWLARGAHASLILTQPVEPILLQEQVAQLLKR